MDKLRRSIRKSFRKAPGFSGSDSTAVSSTNNGITDEGVTTTSSSSSSPWEADAKNVRAGICKFNVKYLGSCEVYESRGVHVCEGALTHLKTRKKPTKAILYISGDGLRVVDRESNRGLIVDQTIEKGERVSHAVGCAFTICLEAKKKREIEQASAAGKSIPSTATTNATTINSEELSKSRTSTSASKYSDLNAVWNTPTPPEPATTTTTTTTPGMGTNNFAKINPAYASFRRQLSITERKLDPQTAILNEPLPSASAAAASSTTKSGLNESTVKPRPVANPSLFDRQGSFKAPTVSQQAFKRFNSLRADLLSRPALDSTRLLNTEPIYEGDETWPESCSNTNSIINTLPVSTSLQFNHIAEGNKENGTESPSWNGIFNPACQSTPLHSARQMPNQIQNQHSKADEWLEQTFKSLSFQPDSRQQSILPQSQSADFIGSVTAGPPPSQPPPPLPVSRPVCDQLPLTTGPIPQMMPKSMMMNNAIPQQQQQQQHHQPLSTSNAILPTNTISPTTTKAVINTVPFDETDDSLKTHVRKGSSTKKSIEYQLLEEEIAPVSPPRNNTPIATDAFGLPIFVVPPPPPPSTTASNNIIRTGPSLSDPFDIQWSTAVLKKVATTTSNGTVATTHSSPPPPPPSSTTAAVPNPFTSESASVNV
uniref:PID domain-containing protein n=1 Tax=Panagrolaimus superbus TaxID=310955 RepID=A0A914YQX7_9BILA